MKARTALPLERADLAEAGLRAELRHQAAQAGKRVDWSTFTVAGPEHMPGSHGVVWFEWAATASVSWKPAARTADDSLDGTQAEGLTP